MKVLYFRETKLELCGEVSEDFFNSVLHSLPIVKQNELKA